MNIEALKTQRLAVVGLGVNNLALVAWLLRQGAQRLTICDQNPAVRLEHPDWVGRVAWRLGADYLNHLSEFDLLFRTPGIPYLSQPIQQAKAAGVIVSSQTKLFFALAPARIIGVTGTKGKGTTATLIFEMLQNQRSQKSPHSAHPSRLATGWPSKATRGKKVKGKVYLAGNIGRDPFEFIDQLTQDDWVVLELSSFQLQDMEQSPDIAVVLDITNDHINPTQHRDRDEYVRAKSNLVAHQNANHLTILHQDSSTTAQFAKLTQGEVWHFSRRGAVDRGSYVRWERDDKAVGEVIFRDALGHDQTVIRTDQLQLRGRHNLENVTAAITCAAIINTPIAIIRKVLRAFRGLPHRLQLVCETQGRKFYDDSFATNPEPVMAAIRSFYEPIHLLVGGSSKQADFQELGEAIVDSSVATVIPLGTHEAQRIVAAIEAARGTKLHPTILPTAQSMREAVQTGFRFSQPGEVILLSPGAASFDLFTNYKERGLAFQHAAEQLRQADHGT